MATKYADRAFISINGARLIDMESATVRQNFNAKAVGTMTDDGFNRGYVEGNREIDVNFVIARQNQLARPKIEAIDFENNDVKLNFICGADQFVVGPLFRKDVEDSAPGVGEESKGTFNLGALKIVDSVGNSSLFDLVL